LGGDGGLLAGVLSSWLGIVISSPSGGLIVRVLLPSLSAVLNPGVCSVILEGSSRGDIFSYTYNKLINNYNMSLLPATYDSTN